MSSSNVSDNASEMSTFLEIPKQNIKAANGKYFIWSENDFLKNIKSVEHLYYF